MDNVANLAGRFLIAVLFFAGALQKVMDPAPVMEMLALLHVPPVTIWPVAIFDLLAAIFILTGPGVRIWALVMAAYCLFTSWFHWNLRADPWQVTIMVKNWSIAGGLLVLAAQGPGRFAFGGRGRP
ncbi:DoxX family protein [Rhodobacteraceae bacterium]|nr:DoxX family protein [Paracoccaceae bacterium]